MTSASGKITIAVSFWIEKCKDLSPYSQDAQCVYALFLIVLSMRHSLGIDIYIHLYYYCLL